MQAAGGGARAVGIIFLERNKLLIDRTPERNAGLHYPAVSDSPVVANHRSTRCSKHHERLLHFYIHDIAVGEYELTDTADGQVLGCRSHHHRNHISGLECLGVEAKVDEGGRSRALANPIYDVALVILNIELQESMGVRPEPRRYGPLYGGLLAVVRRVSVVCKQRN